MGNHGVVQWAGVRLTLERAKEKGSGLKLSGSVSNPIIGYLWKSYAEGRVGWSRAVICKAAAGIHILAKRSGGLVICAMMTVFIVLSVFRHDNGGVLSQGHRVALTNIDVLWNSLCSTQELQGPALAGRGWGAVHLLATPRPGWWHSQTPGARDCFSLSR